MCIVDREQEGFGPMNSRGRGEKEMVRKNCVVRQIQYKENMTEHGTDSRIDRARRFGLYVLCLSKKDKLSSAVFDPQSI